ncbi:membrane protein [Salipaludibacillus agaradhaerens]|uniref:YczE/YyaS/YitT family protein n=1 Tax=Salipaludibacillus agaradhaerens TaxID=76935 RepID=UPI002151E02B|nr:membrane protein [Salipaludibacillus agaradhaerens]MCR6105632.1 membrane protein [Salipaludibacillus agaradhaerens]MCR6117669.1 membrane protein [Salipaludibacillus agaradhaerens]
MTDVLKKKIVMMIIGIVFIGLSIALFRYANMGTDPFTTMNLGISHYLGWSFGQYQLLVNMVLFFVVLVYGRHTIGLGTFVNMVMVGFIADFFMPIVEQTFPVAPSLAFRLVIMVSAVIVACIGISLYMTADLGIAPYDAMAIILIKVSRGKIAFPIARITTDIVCVIIGFSYHAVVGISTVFMVLFTGPLVQLCKKTIWEPLLKEPEQLLVNDKMEAR